MSEDLHSGVVITRRVSRGSRRHRRVKSALRVILIGRGT